MNLLKYIYLLPISFLFFLFSSFMLCGTLISTLVLSVLIRIGATIASCIRRPLLHFVAFRKNWRRIVLATDFGCTPELVPGLATEQEIASVLDENSGEDDKSHIFKAHTLILVAFRSNFQKVTSELLDMGNEKGIVSKFFMRSFIILIFSLFYVVPYLLRFAVKGASILYAPLLAVIPSDPVNLYLGLSNRLKTIRRDPTAWLKIAYSLFSIASLILSYFFPIVVGALHDWLAQFASPYFQVVSEFYVPPAVKLWQVASAINGLLNLYLYCVYVPKASLRLSMGLDRIKDVKFHLDCIAGVQIVLSVYSTVCGIFLLANFVLHHHFPPRQWQWFPVVS